MTAWKDQERRICRRLGGQRRGPTGKGCSDCTDEVPFSTEVKRSVRAGPPVLAKWIEQARLHGKREGKPWLVVVAGHYDRRPVVAMDFDTFVELGRLAGVLADTDDDDLKEVV